MDSNTEDFIFFVKELHQATSRFLSKVTDIEFIQDAIKEKRVNRKTRQICRNLTAISEQEELNIKLLTDAYCTLKVEN